MSLGCIYDIIISPIVTEKTNLQSSGNKFTFEIRRSTSKKDIKTTVKTIFDVDVEKVNIINVKGKVKKFKGTIGRKSDKKKAIVTLKSGQQIDLTKVEGK